jgi:RNA-directed DNA polymerase
VRQGKLGISCGVQVPVGSGLTSHPYRVLRIRRRMQCRATERTIRSVHRESCGPQGSLRSPKQFSLVTYFSAGSDGVSTPEADTKGSLWVRSQRTCRGSAMIIRFADDFVCAFEHQKDAERFYEELGARLGKFGLEVAPDKTRILRFSPFDLPGSGAFEFSGFQFRWRRSRRGGRTVTRRTSRKKLKASRAALTAWIKAKRHCKLPWLLKTLRAKFRGYWNYYGVIGNSASLQSFFYLAQRILFKWLNRRSQRRGYTWKEFADLLTFFQVPHPRITECTGSH